MRSFFCYILRHKSYTEFEADQFRSILGWNRFADQETGISFQRFSQKKDAKTTMFNVVTMIVCLKRIKN